MSWLERSFYGNPLADWAIAAAIAASLALILHLLHGGIVRRLRRIAARTRTRLDDFAAEILAGTRLWFLIAAAIYIGVSYLRLSPRTMQIIDHAAVIVMLVQAAFWGNRAIRAWIGRRLEERRETDAAGATTMSMLGFILRIVLWSLIVLMVIENLGVDITALVASLGIGGVAVALAVQNILGDIFASVSIALDRPFVIGDFIVVGDALGTVEYIGLKTTRLRSLSGEEIVFSNTALLKNRIHNYKRMYERRVLFRFGVTCQTPYEKLQHISTRAREIVASQPKTRFDRAHFKEFGDSALTFEVVYFVLDADYNVYMDIQQAINLALFARFGQERIEFAYPTRTVHLAAGNEAEAARPVHRGGGFAPGGSLAVPGHED